MIAIINDGTNPNSNGLHHYRVQINDTLICEFDHVREDGLAECLRKAANAVDEEREKFISELIDWAQELRYWEHE